MDATIFNKKLENQIEQRVKNMRRKQVGFITSMQDWFINQR